MKKEQRRIIREINQSPEMLGGWTLLSIKCPTKPGFYWVGSFFPPEVFDDGSYFESMPEPYEVGVYHLDKDELKSEYISGINNVFPRNTIWIGPIQPPPLGPLAIKNPPEEWWESKLSQAPES